MSENNRKVASDAHKQFYADSAETFKPVIVFASEGLKTLQFCHGGAMTATLAYAGIILQKSTQTNLGLIFAFTFFSAGLILVLVSWLCAHQSQSAYSDSSHRRDLIWDHPYVVETAASRELERKANKLRSAAVWTAIVSGIMLVLGLASLGALLLPCTLSCR